MRAGGDVRLGDPLRELPADVPVVLATGGFQADRELVSRHITPHADELLLRASPWSTGDGLRLGLAAGGAATEGMDEFYGRNMPAPPARVEEADFVSLAQLYATHATVRNRDGERYEPRTWSEIDVVQWTARQPGARAWYEVTESQLDIRVRDRTVGEMIAAAEAAGAPVTRRGGLTTVEVVAGITTTLGGLRVDGRAQVAPGVFAAGTDVGGIATGGYASGLAAALVLGRIAAAAALGESVGSATVQHAFGTSDPLTLGLEEELLLVDPASHQLAHVAEDVLARVELPEALAAHEAFAAEIELRTPVCRTAGEALAALTEARAAARAAGATLMGVGLHPAARWGDVRMTDKPRYRALDQTMRSLIKRTPECALHVHVGAPDPDSAIDMLNGLREHLPLLQGLAANSPYWFGADSGLASARFSIVRAYPRRGVPRFYSGWDEYAETVQATGAAGEFDDYTLIWWDVRAHPRVGTVEVRELDAQSSLEDAAALAALVQALAARALDSPPDRGLPAEAIGESSFRASRDGLDATILADGALRPLREVARATAGSVAGYARELGSADALDGIERILREGGGAARQRAAAGRDGIGELLAQLVSDTEAAA